MKYAFLRDYEPEFRMRSMCRALGVHPQRILRIAYPSPAYELSRVD